MYRKDFVNTQNPMKITKILASLTFTTLLAGCESIPDGAKFHTTMLPAVDSGEATIVVYRDYTNPRGLDGRVAVDGTQLFTVPNHSFGYATLKSGPHSLQLKWAPGMSGWEDLVNLEGGKTYYYQLKSSVILLASSSELVSVPESLAKVTLNTCCRLVEEITSKASAAPDAATALRSDDDVANLKVRFHKLKKEMSPNEVLALLGAPDDVASKKTWKTDIPFYFGPDDRWIVWTYKNVGYVAFIQNKFSGDIAVEKFGIGLPN